MATGSVLALPLEPSESKVTYSDSEDEGIVVRRKKSTQRAFSDSDEEPLQNSRQDTENVNGSSSDEEEVSGQASKSRRRIVIGEDSDSDEPTAKADESFADNTRNPGGNVVKNLEVQKSNVYDAEGSHEEDDLTLEDINRTVAEKTKSAIKQRFQLSIDNDLYDAEGSSDEENHRKSTSYGSGADNEEDGCSLDAIKKTVKGKAKKEAKQASKPKRASALQAAQQIHSETQRMIRESRIALPYHRPRQRTLTEFLNRRRSTPLAAKSLRLSTDELGVACKQLEERVKKAEEFYKSDSEHSDEENPKNTNKDSEGVHKDSSCNGSENAPTSGITLEHAPSVVGASDDSGIHVVCASSNQRHEGECSQYNDSVPLLQDDGLGKNAQCDQIMSESVKRDSSRVGDEEMSQVTNGNQSFMDNIQDESKGERVDGVKSVSGCDSRETEESEKENEDSSAITMKLVLEESSSEEKKEISGVECVIHEEVVDELLSKNNPTLSSLTSDGTESEFSVNLSNKDSSVVHHKENVSDKNPEEYNKSQTNTAETQDEDFQLFLEADSQENQQTRRDEIVNKFFSECKKSEELTNSSNKAVKDDKAPRNEAKMQKLASRFSSLRNIASLKPRLSSENNIIDLEEVAVPRGTPKQNGVQHFMHRFMHHASGKKQAAQKEISLRIETKEKNEEGEEEIKEESISLLLDPEPEGPKEPRSSLPGSKHFRLQEELHRRIAKQRGEEWHKKLEAHKLDNEEDEEDIQDEKDLVLDDDHELTDQTDTEEEEVDDDDIATEELFAALDKKRQKSSAYVDDEAEETDEEESSAGEGGDDLDDEGTKEKKPSRIIRPASDSEDEKDEREEIVVPLKDDIEDVELGPDATGQEKPHALTRKMTTDLFASQEALMMEQSPDALHNDEKKTNPDKPRTLTRKMTSDLFDSQEAMTDRSFDGLPLEESGNPSTQDKDTSLLSDASFELFKPLPPGQLALKKKEKPALQGNFFNFLTPIQKLTPFQGMSLSKSTDSLSSSSVNCESLDNTPRSVQRSTSHSSSDSSNRRRHMSQKKLFTDDESVDSQNNMDDLLALCSGKFGDTLNRNFSEALNKPKSRSNVDDLVGLCSDEFNSQKLPESLPDGLEKLVEPQSAIDAQDELIELCSGKFNTNPGNFETMDGHTTQSTQITLPLEDSQDFKLTFSEDTDADLNKRELTMLKMHDRMHRGRGATEGEKMENSQNGLSLSQRTLELGEENSDNAVWDQLKIVSDDEEDVFKVTENPQSKKKKKRRKRKLDYSDDEDEELNNEDYEDEEGLYDYDSEENEIEKEEEPAFKGFTVKGKKGLFRPEFLENEAELSESEWGSEDEDEQGLDRLELEEGDKDNLNEDEVREELGKIHMRRVLDEDQRDVKLFQERFLEDGEFHSDGPGRERKFRWKNLDIDPSEFRALDSDEEGQEQEGEEENEEELRKMRFEREKLLREQELKTGEDDGVVLDDNSELLKLGKAAMKRMMTSNSQDIMRDNENPLKRTSSEPIHSPDGKNPLKLLVKRGSFLNRNDGALQRLAEFTRSSGPVSGPRNTRNFVFAALSPEKKNNADDKAKVVPKRKASDAPVAKNLKKQRLDRKFDETSEGASVFKFL